MEIYIIPIFLFPFQTFCLGPKKRDYEVDFWRSKLTFLLKPRKLDSDTTQINVNSLIVAFANSSRSIF